MFATVLFVTGSASREWRFMLIEMKNETSIPANAIIRVTFFLLSVQPHFRPYEIYESIVQNSQTGNSNAEARGGKHCCISRNCHSKIICKAAADPSLHKQSAAS